jgi:hypothetical protein
MSGQERGEWRQHRERGGEQEQKGKSTGKRRKGRSIACSLGKKMGVKEH